MLKNEIDVLVIAHNICIAFDYLNTDVQDRYILRLRAIEKDVCRQARDVQSKEKDGRI